MKFDENVFPLRRSQPTNEKNELIFNLNDEVPKDIPMMKFQEIVKKQI